MSNLKITANQSAHRSDVTAFLVGLWLSSHPEATDLLGPCALVYKVGSKFEDVISSPREQITSFLMNGSQYPVKQKSVLHPK